MCSSDLPPNAKNNLPSRIEALINQSLPAGSKVSVEMVSAFAIKPALVQVNDATVQLKIKSSQGDVLIEPAASHDCAVQLMLGTAQGGLEVSRYAGSRPAPSGYTTSLNDLITFGALPQTGTGSFNILTVNGADLDLSSAPHAIQTVTNPAVKSARFYQIGRAHV